MSILCELLDFTQILVMQKILLTNELQGEKDLRTQVYLLVTLFSIVVLSKIVNTWVDFKVILLGKKTFYALSELVLEKTLNFSRNIQKEFDIGEIINLGTVDSNKFSQLSYQFQRIVISPVMIILGMIYLYRLVGMSLLIGLFFTLVSMVINMLIVKRRMKYQE